jgi:hypothetical protein
VGLEILKPSLAKPNSHQNNKTTNPPIPKPKPQKKVKTKYLKSKKSLFRVTQSGLT